MREVARSRARPGIGRAAQPQDRAYLGPPRHDLPLADSLVAQRGRKDHAHAPAPRALPGSALQRLAHDARAPRQRGRRARPTNFVDRARFLHRAPPRGPTFLEWAEVHGNLYGTSIAEIERARAAAGCSGMIFDIDYQGARQIRCKVADVVSVFILPPSMTWSMPPRLRGRRRARLEGRRCRAATSARA